MRKNSVWIAIISIPFNLYILGAHATIIDTSKNPAVFPGAVAYIGGINGGPTPHQVGGPSPQSVFLPIDPIRIAQSISLADVNKIADDNSAVNPDTGDIIWDYWDNGNVISGLVWSVDWYDPTDAFVDSNLKFVSWADIDVWKANPNFTQISFWTDLFVPNTYGPLMSGTWNADIFFDGNYHSTASFVISAPASILLFSAGLMMLRRRAK